MMLSELKRYLSTVKVANLADLTSHLNTDPGVIRDMLGHWIRKGYVRKSTPLPGCGSKCGKCSPLKTEIYEWVISK